MTSDDCLGTEIGSFGDNSLSGHGRRKNWYQTMNKAGTDQSPDHAKLEDSFATRPTRTRSIPSQQSRHPQQNKAVKANLAQNNRAMQDQQTRNETKVQEIQHSIPNKYQNSKRMQRWSNDNYCRECMLLTTNQCKNRMLGIESYAWQINTWNAS